MRPTRLVVDGFTAFRDVTELDFTSADLFAFTGPTGAGKSSLVDAMVFALYGTVPRLDRRAVAPIVSLGRTEARVLLEFTVGGQGYRAARVVRRTKTGATTKEARLERIDGPDAEVLAGNEKELTQAVERLLGLGFEHFTTCVVLPQGEFMRLLHEEPNKRQDLLVSLLDLGLFERMGRLARRREHGARQRGEVADALGAKLAFATPDALDAAGRRLAALERVAAAVDEAAPELERLRHDADHAAARANEARAALERLDGVAVPRGLAEHATARADARDAIAAADAVVAERQAAAEATEAAVARLPDRSAAERVVQAHAQAAELRAEQATVGARWAEQDEARTLAVEGLSAAESAQAEAAAALDRAQWEHRAHDLVAHLVAGEPCPVCEQVVDVVPSAVVGDGPSAARQAKEAADAAVADARTRAARAQQAVDRASARQDSVAERLAALDALVADGPGATAAEGVLSEVTAAEGAERAARREVARAQKVVVAARRAADEVERREVEARQAFGAIRDRLAPLGPPAAAHDDLAADWAALADWVAAVRPEQEAAVAAATDAVQGAVAAGRELAQRLRDAAAAVGAKAPEGADVRLAVAEARAEASADRGRIMAALAEVATHRDEGAVARREADTARELARLLSANHFEKWVLDEALAQLVEGATELLRELSGGAFSLGLDERASFLVVDHRNADEVRPAKTLSGGETFLASLALALALADQVGGLAADGSARLESIFLDEGFGTLDPESLDTVIAAIEELGARGRMVGLISHVPELAERVPVRFEVTRTPGGSKVDRVVV